MNNKINTYTSFNGYYKLKYKPEYRKLFDEEIIPPLNSINYPIQMFSGRNPLAPHIMGSFERLADHNNASIVWLKNHAKIYNVDLPTDDDDVLYIATGKKDTKEMIKFGDNMLVMLAKNILKTIIKKFSGIKSKEHIPGEPTDIEDLRMLTRSYNQSQKEFDRFMEDKNFNKCDSLEDFLIALVKELENSAS